MQRNVVGCDFPLASYAAFYLKAVFYYLCVVKLDILGKVACVAEVVVMVCRAYK